jgi:SulP family sulfate permease
MALLILFASDLVSFVALPALAGLLIVVGAGAIKPSRIYSVVKSGALPTAIMAVTFGLTLVIPLQFAVLVGVGLGIILFVAQQSNHVRVRQVHIADDGRMRESDPPPKVPRDDVLILQPYGSLFFASAPIFEKQLPAVNRESSGSVVIIRLRGTDQIGLSLVAVLRRYAHELRNAGSSLKLVVSEKRVLDQIEADGLADDLGEENVYSSTEWIGETVRRAYADARAEIRD